MNDVCGIEFVKEEQKSRQKNISKSYMM